MESQAREKVNRNDLDQHFRAKSCPLDELTNTLTSHFAKTTLLQLGLGDHDSEENDYQKEREETFDADDETQTQDEEEEGSPGSPMFQGGFIENNEENQLSMPSKRSLQTYTLATEENQQPHSFDYVDTLGSLNIVDEVNKLKQLLKEEMVKTKVATDRLKACESARAELADKIPRLLSSLSTLT